MLRSVAAFASASHDVFALGCGEKSAAHFFNANGVEQCLAVQDSDTSVPA
jgi:hypothetical protein